MPESPAGTALRQAGQLASAGRRTLVLAWTAVAVPPAAGVVPPSPPGPAPVTLLTFRERVRPDAARTLAYFQDQGGGTRIISGDDPQTVAVVAREVGVAVERGYDARALPSDPKLLSDVMEREHVFGRVTPAQKKEMLHALQRRGHVVAMTGDGVNDALALKSADIGIAMDTAAAATTAVSRLVLLDGRFDHLPAVVAEGRRVIANMETVSVLFLSKTAYAVALSLVFGGLLWGFPFLPRQLSATDGLTIGLPCFLLALMPNTRRYRLGFLRRSLSFAVPAGLIITVGIVAVNAFAVLHGGYRTSEVQGASAIVLSLIAAWTLVVVARPLTPARFAVVLAMYAGLGALLSIPVVRDFFNLAIPPSGLLQVVVVASFAGCVGVEVLGRVRKHADDR